MKIKFINLRRLEYVNEQTQSLLILFQIFVSHRKDAKT